MTKRTIPEIRELIGELTEESQTLARRQFQIAQQIGELAEETRRRSYSRTPVKSKNVTNTVRTSVRKMAANNPDASHQEIADAHGINPGRVSEILHGKR